MEYEYVVEVRDFIRNHTIVSESFTDANTAYHLYRQLNDKYREFDSVVVQLTEPTY